MNIYSYLVLTIASFFILSGNRKTAIAAFVIAICYIIPGQGIKIAGLSFPAARLLLIILYARTRIRNEKSNAPPLQNYLNITFCVWLLFASLFHSSIEGAGFVYSAGIALDLLLIFFVFTATIQNTEDLKQLFVVFSIWLVPIAIEMILEQSLHKNFFSAISGQSDHVLIRNGTIRSQGPFRHPITAGNIGATCLPFFIAIINTHKARAIIGIISCIVIVLMSASSGPILTLIAAFIGMAAWKYRASIHKVKAYFIAIYILLELLMSQPAYYLIARIDLTGSSTGWHRARLIESSIEHLSEWWIFGTDYTRHWMPTGVPFSENHTDITNYYLAFGVMGGLPLIIIMLTILYKAFQRIESYVNSNKKLLQHDRYIAWCTGASLFAQAVTSISVSHMAQAVVFFWMTIAITTIFFTDGHTNLETTN
ncbi:hypothetical protein IEN85_16385 [Pelagicoccus sp. NFK12]|uniref:Uncharacterized protein n=1 Tax=Pelagicoccus enzymogenes TaxID=2773457 RepID=A0A927IIS8_9BACT|nr:hypothetical protein [Pelagicoccus enzymogenes]MBD5781078.1 hypothetical protein [Pelagicoccus enzymogenes]